MTDDELQEDRKLREIVQKAYGVDEETLLKRLEEADQSVDDSKFEGVEERLCQKFMERVKKEENAAAGKTPATPKKVVRFGKKRMLLVAALVALFALAVGSTAIGGKNYFFKLFDNGEKNNLILDNDKNKTDASNLEEAYETIKNELNLKVMKLGYVPEALIFEELNIDSTSAIIQFQYHNQKVYFIQNGQDKEVSASSMANRANDITVTNDWLSKEIGIVKKELEDGTAEYNAQIYINNTYYWLVGNMTEDEFINIVKNINFY